MRILQVLRALVLSPAGDYLSDENICDIMISCFRICFGISLTELLRRTAEHCLRDIIHHLFLRLPSFVDDTGVLSNISKIQTDGMGIYQTQARVNSANESDTHDLFNPINSMTHFNDITADDICSIPSNPVNINNYLKFDSSTIKNSTEIISNEDEETSNNVKLNDKLINNAIQLDEAPLVPQEIQYEPSITSDNITKTLESFQKPTNSLESTTEQGRPHLVQSPTTSVEDFPAINNDSQYVEPYGALCIRELFRFLISLCNPHDKQNTEIMTHHGLNFLQIALETSVDALANFPSLLALMKDELPKNLITLLSTERLSILITVLQVAFLLFESQRQYLKFQMEHYLLKLMTIINSESKVITNEQRELALEAIIRLWRIPGLPAELYLNYDCGLYSANLNEELVKLLTTNACAAVDNMNSIQNMSLDAIIMLVTDIETKFCDFKDQYKLSRHISSPNLPTREELITTKANKQWLAIATDKFNDNPREGIIKLAEHGLFGSIDNPDVEKIVKLLRDNPMMDKQAIAEYISNKENTAILNAFIESLDVSNMRVDQALRFFLETFRLPGEAPLIERLLEKFAEHWHDSNGRPFASADAAFTLAYAVIILNVDQHNAAAKRQNPPMTAEQFKRNVAGQNGDGDFDQDMVDEIYNSIKNDEIVMPAEQTGLVKENYLWKVVLRRGASPESIYLMVGNDGEFVNGELAERTWAPIINALCIVYDNAADRTRHSRVAQAFLSCAAITAHYDLTNDLDMLIVPLCKFTGLTRYNEPDNIVLHFGGSRRRLLAARILFRITRLHGSGLRASWKNIITCLLYLRKAKLLPDNLTDTVDFLNNAQRELLIAERAPKQPQEQGLFASIYSYIALESPRVPHPNEKTARKRATDCIANCYIREIIQESKFLMVGSLRSLVTTLTFVNTHDEDSEIFLLEIMVQVIIENGYRVTSIWPIVLEHIDGLLTIADKKNRPVLRERIILGVLRLAINLLCGEEYTWTLWPLLIPLSRLPAETIFPLAWQISNGLFDLLKSGAVYIHSLADWKIIFDLLEFIGAGAIMLKPEIHKVVEENLATSLLGVEHTSPAPQWVLVAPTATESPLPIVADTIVFKRDFIKHDPAAFVKCCESLEFLIHNVYHVTPFNFQLCIRCICTFAEAVIQEPTNRIRLISGAVDTASYQQCPMQLLKLLYTLYIHAGEIFKVRSKKNEIKEPINLWNQAWRPLLQGIARLCCDSRQSVRAAAITYLQKILQSHDLMNLSATEWSQCLEQILFPLLAKLLNPMACNDPAGIEETRIRLAMLLSKVFLHNLTMLLCLPGFLPLWLTVLDLLKRYMHADNSELLLEAIPETLKNMLLVMSSTGVLNAESHIWQPTWQMINIFLPNLKGELLPDPTLDQLSPEAMPAASIINLVTLVDQEQPSFEGSIVVSPVTASLVKNTQKSVRDNPEIVNNSTLLPSTLAIAQQVPQTSLALTVDVKEQQQVINLINQPPPCVSSPIAVQPTAESLTYQTNVPNVLKENGYVQQQINYPSPEVIDEANSKILQEDSATYRHYVVTNP